MFGAAVLLLAVTAAFPLLSRAGLLNTRGGGDSPFLLQRLYELVVALRDGHFPVRWMPNANYGYGYPFYNYYAPLSIYIAAVFRFLGLSYVGAIKASQLAGFLVAGGGMFYLGRQWFKSRWAGLLVAAAYTFAPFHMVNIYVRGDSLAEFWAMACYPLVLITADYLSRSPKRPLRLVLFALSYAALILSHNISALIFTPFLLLYLTLSLIQKSRQSTSQRQVGHQPINKPTAGWPLTDTRTILILSISLAFLLALSLSAWFWLPALAEQGLAQLEPVTAGYFHFTNHFRGLDLVQNSILFDYDVAGGRAFRMGLVQLMVIGAGITALLIRWVRKRRFELMPSLMVVTGLLIATFMITPLSRPLWDNLPLLPFTQFPWRFLSVQAFFGALAAGGIALLPGRKVIVPLVILVIAISGLGNLQTDHLVLTDADVTAGRLAEYEWFTGNLGSTVSAEYLPDYVRPRPFTGPWLGAGTRLSLLQANTVFEARPISQETDIQEWLVSTTAPEAEVTLPVLAWPGWQAAIDGSVVESQPAPGSGLLTLTVPSGSHTVELRLTRTPVRLAAELVSLAAVLIIFLLFLPFVRRYANRRHLKWLAAGFIGLVIISIGLRLRPISTLAPDTLSWDFEQLGYLHHAPEGIPFENDLLLRSYRYNQDILRPGENLSIALNWENGNGTTAEIALLTPAVQRIEAAPILAAQSQPVESDQVVYRLAIPENAPSGLYVPRLTAVGARPLSDSGRVRGDLYLRPVRVLGNSRPADPAGLPLNVRAVDVTYQSPDVLLVQMEWLTSEMLTKNYVVSLRVVDNRGLLVVQRDAQPGFGYQPSSGWLPGRWQDDWLTLSLSDDFMANQTGEAPYALVAHLYDAQTEAVALTRRLGEMVWEGDDLVFQEVVSDFELPDGISPAVAAFEEGIQLEGYILEQAAGSIDLTLYWQAPANSREDYFHFVHLVDPETGSIVAQHDSMPRNNTYPTSQWRTGEIIADNLRLDLAGVPAGEYLLYAGLYRNLDDTFPPLAAVDGTGRPLEDNRLLLEKVVIGE